MESPKFLTQWNTDHSIFVHDISDEDFAIPDLTYSIQELRQKFTLESELLQGKLKRPAQYLFNNIDENNEDEAFDSPSVDLPRDFDLVDADAAKTDIRNAVRRLQNLKISALESQEAQIPPSVKSATEPGES